MPYLQWVWMHPASTNRFYKEELTQLRRHNTVLAGQVRALQDHINGQCARRQFMTVAQMHNPLLSWQQINLYFLCMPFVLIFLLAVWSTIILHNKFCDGGKKTKSCSRWSDCTGPLTAGTSRPHQSRSLKFILSSVHNLNILSLLHQ